MSPQGRNNWRHRNVELNRGDKQSRQESAVAVRVSKAWNVMNVQEGGLVCMGVCVVCAQVVQESTAGVQKAQEQCGRCGNVLECCTHAESQESAGKWKVLANSKIHYFRGQWDTASGNWEAFNLVKDWSEIAQLRNSIQLAKCHLAHFYRCGHINATSESLCW